MNIKRSLSLILALVLVLSAAPLGAKAFTLIQLKGTDVTLDETTFPYTGEEIRPNVTVRVGDTLLTLDRDYRLEFQDNTEVGTGKVIVTGIGTASTTVGYTGTVEIPFAIEPYVLKAGQATLEGSEFAYTGSFITPKVTVKVGDKVLIPGVHYALSFRDNVEPGTAAAIINGIGDAGYTGRLELPFTITKPAPYTLKGTDVTIEGTEFPYTGTFVTPKVTVTAGGKVLTPGVHYALTFHNNIAAGTATATVDGIEDAGYIGQVNISFTILPDEGPGYVEIPLTEKNVSIEGTSFPYTGKAVEPKVTVTVEGKTLTAGKDYSLSYVNNVEPGTATAIIRGKGTASETLGYSGEVKVNFTIVKAATPPETKPEETEPEETKPEETKPEETEPEETKPEETKPESVSYKITKGDKSTWYKGSAKTLSFTSDGKFADFKGVQIDGKALDSKYYTAKEGTTVALKSAFLQKLAVGKHTITILFADGQAEGAFKVSAALDTTNPETSDNFQMGLWMSLMGLSLAGTMSLILLRKKIF